MYHNDDSINDDNVALQNYQTYLSSRLNERMHPYKNRISSINKNVDKILSSLHDLSLYDNKEKDGFCFDSDDSDGDGSSSSFKNYQQRNSRNYRDIMSSNGKTTTNEKHPQDENETGYQNQLQAKQAGNQNFNSCEYESWNDDESQEEKQTRFKSRSEPPSKSNYAKKLSRIANRVSQKNKQHL